MPKNEKPASQDFDAQRDAEAKAAKKKLKEAGKAKSSGAKKDKAEKGDKKKAKKVGRFWKDFRGEIKKIVWPDFKSVMKNTGIVLLVTVIIGSMVWILDFALSESVLGLKNLAQGVRAGQTTADFGDYTTQPATTLAIEEDTTGGAETQATAQAETEPETEPETVPATTPAETEATTAAE